MQIIGEVQAIIYKSEINGYAVAEFETEEETTTIVGYLPFINIGDNLKLTGKYVEHKDYGMQFKVDTFEKIMPQTLDALKKYLINGNIKGIGKQLAERIIKKFGEETIHIFRDEPKRLAEVRGISENKAIDIALSFEENWEVWQIVGFLEKFGLGAEYAKKVFNLLGRNAIEQIEANPYILIDISRGRKYRRFFNKFESKRRNYNRKKRRRE